MVVTKLSFVVGNNISVVRESFKGVEKLRSEQQHDTSLVESVLGIETVAFSHCSSTRSRKYSNIQIFVQSGQYKLRRNCISNN